MKTINKEQTLGIIRHILTFISGLLVMKGFITDTVAMEIIGSTMMLIGSIWSISGKRK
jgi:hypothetical protein